MNQKKQHHSYLFCCGCTLIRHAVEQSLRACGSETNGGREPLDLLKRRRRLKKRFLKRGQRRLKSLEQCRCVGTVCTAVAGRPRVQLGRVGRKSKEVLQREPRLTSALDPNLLILFAVAKCCAHNLKKMRLMINLLANIDRAEHRGPAAYLFESSPISCSNNGVCSTLMLTLKMLLLNVRLVSSNFSNLVVSKRVYVARHKRSQRRGVDVTIAKTARPVRFKVNVERSAALLATSFSARGCARHR